MKTKKSTFSLPVAIIIVLSALIYSSEAQATKVLPSDFDTLGYSEKIISTAENKILFAEEKIDEINKRGLDNIVSEKNLDVARKTLDKIIPMVENSRKNLITAKQYFITGNYFKASEYASLSSNEAMAAEFYLSNILKDQITPEGIRLESVSNVKQPELPKVPSSGTKEILEISQEEEQIIKSKKEFIIAPREGFKEIIIEPGEKILIKDAKKEIIAPKEGFKIVVAVEYGEDKIKEITIQSSVDKTIISVGGATVRDCEEYLKECNSGNSILCTKWETNCKTKTSAITKELITVKDNRIYLKREEIKLMPDDVSEIAAEKLDHLNFTIELKDSGTKDTVRPVYEINSSKKVRILGIFSAQMSTTMEVDAVTKVAGKIKKPWWSFLSF